MPNIWQQNPINVKKGFPIIINVTPPKQNKLPFYFVFFAKNPSVFLGPTNEIIPIIKEIFRLHKQLIRFGGGTYVADYQETTVQEHHDSKDEACCT